MRVRGDGGQGWLGSELVGSGVVRSWGRNHKGRGKGVGVQRVVEVGAKVPFARPVAKTLAASFT